MQNKVINIVSQILNKSEETLSIDSSVKTVDTWDSLNHMKILLAVEDAFGFRFSDEQMGSVSSIKDIVDIIQARGK